MKILFRCLVIILLAANSVAGAGVASKTRVGLSLELKGCSEDGTPMVNLFGLPLYRDIVFRGNIISFSPSMIVLGDVDTKIKIPQGLYFLEIVTGSNAGVTSDITDDWNGSLVISLKDDLSQLLNVGEVVRIGRHNTLYSVFGKYNERGLKPGNTVAEADNLIVFDSATQSFELFFYSISLLGWAKENNPASAVADFPIPPGQGLFLRRKEAAPIKLSLRGYFIDDFLSIKVRSGINIITDMQFRSIKETEFFQKKAELESINDSPVRADALMTYSTMNSPAGSLQIIEAKTDAWIASVGLSPTDRISVVKNTAFVLVTPIDFGFSYIKTY